MDQTTEARQLTGTYKFLAGFVILGGLALRLWIAPSYGYLGVEGDLIEQKQAVHRAITLGFHEIYTANPVNDPAITVNRNLLPADDPLGNIACTHYCRDAVLSCDD